jgi:hypothetical protein
MKRVINKIKNLIRWFPIIWKDQDWDHSFIWEILKFKLRNQAEYIGKHDRHNSAKRDAEIMLLCYRLIYNVQEGFYSHEYVDYQETKFRFEDTDSCEDCKELFIDEISEHFDDYFKKYPLIYKRVINNEKNIFKTETKAGIAMNIARINHDRAKKLLFKILENHIEGWWD